MGLSANRDKKSHCCLEIGNNDKNIWKIFWDAESLGSIPAVFLTRIPTIQIGGIILSGAEYMNYGIFNGLAINLFAPMTHKMMTKILSSGDVKFPAFLKIKMGITDEVFQPMLKQACQNLTLETTKATFGKR